MEKSSRFGLRGSVPVPLPRPLLVAFLLLRPGFKGCFPAAAVACTMPRFGRAAGEAGMLDGVGF